MKSRFSAVIFDLDGTLVDSEGLANLTMAEHLNRIGVPLNAAEIEAWLKGRSLPDCYAMVHERFGVTVTEAVDAAMQADFFQRLRRDLQPMPQARLARHVGTHAVQSTPVSEGAGVIPFARAVRIGMSPRESRPKQWCMELPEPVSKVGMIPPRAPAGKARWAVSVSPLLELT